MRKTIKLLERRVVQLKEELELARRDLAHPERGVAALARYQEARFCFLLVSQPDWRPEVVGVANA